MTERPQRSAVAPASLKNHRCSIFYRQTVCEPTREASTYIIIKYFGCRKCLVSGRFDPGTRPTGILRKFHIDNLTVLTQSDGK